MIRKEEITKAAVDSLHSSDNTGLGYIAGFEDGAEWADKTMIDKVCDFIVSGKVYWILNGDKEALVRMIRNKFRN